MEQVQPNSNSKATAATNQLITPPARPALDPSFGGVLGTIEVLTDVESAGMRECEATILRGWGACVDVGLALARIRDKRLYKAEFSSFEAYCQIRWGFQHTKAYWLIAAAEVATAIREIPDAPKPDNESQLRPLFGLSASQVRLAWQYAAANSCGQRVTAQRVRRAVKDLQLIAGTPTTETKREPTVSKSEQRRLISNAIGELLALVSQKAEYDILIEKIEALHSRFQAFAEGRS
jgi:hypothetical protein